VHPTLYGDYKTHFFSTWTVRRDINIFYLILIYRNETWR